MMKKTHPYLYGGFTPQRENYMGLWLDKIDHCVNEGIYILEYYVVLHYPLIVFHLRTLKCNNEHTGWKR